MSLELPSAGGPRGAAPAILFSQHLLHHLFALIVARNRASHGAGVGRTATEESPERGPATSSAVSIAYSVLPKRTKPKPSRASRIGASVPCASPFGYTVGVERNSQKNRVHACGRRARTHARYNTYRYSEPHFPAPGERAGTLSLNAAA